MLSDDFLTYRQPKSGSSIPFGRFEQREDRLELGFGDTDSVVFDFDLRRVLGAQQIDGNFGVGSTAGRIDRVEDEVQHRAVDTIGIDACGMWIGRWVPGELDVGISCGSLSDRQGVLDQEHQVGRFAFWFTFFAHRQHIENERFDTAVRFFADFPAGPNGFEFVAFEAFMDHVAAPLETLQDVFDVVREVGDGLSDGG